MGSAFLNNVRVGLDALLHNKIRSVLTMLGVIIGVFSIILLIGIGQGVKRDVKAEVTELGSNTLYVLPGQVLSESGGFNPAASVGASTLKEDDAESIEQLPDIERGTVISLISGLPKAGEYVIAGSFNLAVEPSFFDIMTTAKLVAGRTFRDEDNATGAKVMVMDTIPRETLFPGLSAQQVVGKTVQLNGDEYTVIGLLETPQSNSVFSSGHSFSSALYIPYATAKTTNANTQVFRIVIQANPEADITAVAVAIKERMKERHNDVEDFTVLTQDDLLRVIDNILTILTSAVAGIGAISLLVGGIGIMNIMLVSVTERTKEIGLRKAVGASNGNILFQFLTEAVVLSIAGGAVGVLGAYGVGRIVENKAGLTVVVDLTSAGIAVLFSLIVGLIFGVAPAIRAARLNPIQALRYE